MKSQGKSGKSFFEKSYDPLNGMSMTYEYIQTTHEWHTSDMRMAYDWITNDIKVHTIDNWHTSDIRVT